MDGDAVLEVLKEIRDEAKQTNARLDQTNLRLESLEGRMEFLERRVTAGFDKLTEEIDSVWRRQLESETRLATEVLSLASVTRDVKDLLLDANISELKARVATLEQQLASRPQ